MNARAEFPFHDVPPAEERQIAQLRVPPHSVEAESSVLGALMLDNTAWDRCADLLTDADFYRSEHREIFLAIGGLVNANKTADMITVFERLQAAGKADQVGGLAFLHSLAQYVPSASNLRRYAEIVRERALSRRLVKIGDEIAALGFTEGEPIADRIDNASGLLVSLVGSKSDADWVDMESMAVTYIDHANARASGDFKDDVISTGLRELDDLLDGGFRPGELIIIAARPSIGKTALAVTCSLTSAAAGHREGMFSLEMPKEQVAQRAVSTLSGVHLSVVRKAERMHDGDWPRITNAVERLRNLPFYVAEQSAPNINQIRAKARLLKRSKGLDKLTVDYIGLTSGTNPKEPRHQQLGEVSRGLKGLAKELAIPVIALAQLKRDIEQRTNSRPMLSDLKDSGDIEQDADVVIFIDRPYHNNRDLGPAWEHYAELIVAKNRNGSTGSANARYIGKNVEFIDWEGDKPTKLTARSSGGGL